mgnify:CR=1 FL=1
MNLYLKAIKKLKEYSCNNSIRTHWKILGEVSLSNEESATICFWKLYGGVNTEYISHDKNHQTNIFLQRLFNRFHFLFTINFVRFSLWALKMVSCFFLLFFGGKLLQ